MLFVIYTGYSPDFNNDNYRSPDISKNIGGSEYAVIYLSRELVKLGHEVYVANAHVRDSMEYLCQDGVKYCSFNKFNTINLNRKIDVLIISRYINAFIHCFVRATKIYIWVHDVIIHDAYNGDRLAHNSYCFLNNMLPSITGITAQTEWHANVLKQIYPNPEIHKKIFLVPNGVDDEIINLSYSVRSRKKIPNTFIYASHHSRGLQFLLKLWPFILSNKPDARLFIYGEKIPETAQYLNEARALEGREESSVFVYDKVPHVELFEKMLDTEYWIYPTNFPETFCMISLEAQLAGCKCICSDSGGLKNTIGRYGIVLNQDSLAQDWIEAINSTYWTDEILNQQIENARRQTWSERATRFVTGLPQNTF